MRDNNHTFLVGKSFYNVNSMLHFLYGFKLVHYDLSIDVIA